MKRQRYNISVKDNNVEKALRVLSKKYRKDGFFKELRDKSRFEKGSERKIRKAKEMKANTIKKKKIRERGI